jgi:hypothetical protein
MCIVMILLIKRLLEPKKEIIVPDRKYSTGSLEFLTDHEETRRPKFGRTTVRMSMLYDDGSNIEDSNTPDDEPHYAVIGHSAPPSDPIYDFVKRTKRISTVVTRIDEEAQ